MEWIPIDRENLPENEVLAAKIDLVARTVEEIQFGFVGVGNTGRILLLDDRDYVILYPAHYFDPKTLKIPEEQNNVLKPAP